MARRKQEGNRFFRLDVDFFSDKKIKILKARYGADGITLYMYLLYGAGRTVFYIITKTKRLRGGEAWPEHQIKE